MYSEKQLEEQVKNQLAEGNVNDVKVFENIVDKDGHKRFIEGEITGSTLPAGVQRTYGKWSLSGSHLLVVIALQVDNTTVIPAYTNLGNLSGVPQWIFDKLVVLFAGNILDQKSMYFFSSSGSSQNFNTRLYKGASTINLSNTGELTFTDDRTGRIAYDFLIDNE